MHVVGSNLYYIFDELLACFFITIDVTAEGLLYVNINTMQGKDSLGGKGEASGASQSGSSNLSKVYTSFGLTLSQ